MNNNKNIFETTCIINKDTGGLIKDNISLNLYKDNEDKYIVEYKEKNKIKKGVYDIFEEAASDYRLIYHGERI